MLLFLGVNDFAIAAVGSGDVVVTVVVAVAVAAAAVVGISCLSAACCWWLSCRCYCADIGVFLFSMGTSDCKRRLPVQFANCTLRTCQNAVRNQNIPPKQAPETNLLIIPCGPCAD